MKKADLVDALERYAHNGKSTMKGQGTLALYLANYFDALEIPADQEYSFWRIDEHLPELLIGAMDLLCTSEDDHIKSFRLVYERETERPFPTDMIHAQQGNGIPQIMVASKIKDIAENVTGNPYIGRKVEELFGAEMQLLHLEFHQFINHVYRRGLYERIDKCRKRGMSGVFGQTKLLSFVTAGRIMLTFGRTQEDLSPSVSFLCEDGDPLGIGAGCQSLYADLRTAIDMLKEVEANWPISKRAQWRVFRPDTEVGLF